MAINPYPLIINNFLNTFGSLTPKELNQDIVLLGIEIEKVLSISRALALSEDDVVEILQDRPSIALEQSGRYISLKPNGIAVIVRKTLLEGSLKQRYQLYRGKPFQKDLQYIQELLSQRREAARELADQPLDPQNPSDLAERIRRFKTIQLERASLIVAMKSWDLAQQEGWKAFSLIEKILFVAFSFFHSLISDPFSYKKAVVALPSLPQLRLKKNDQEHLKLPAEIRCEDAIQQLKEQVNQVGFNAVNPFLEKLALGRAQRELSELGELNENSVPSEAALTASFGIGYSICLIQAGDRYNLPKAKSNAILALMKGVMEFSESLKRHVQKGDNKSLNEANANLKLLMASIIRFKESIEPRFKEVEFGIDFKEVRLFSNFEGRRALLEVYNILSQFPDFPIVKDLDNQEKAKRARETIQLAERVLFEEARPLVEKQPVDPADEYEVADLLRKYEVRLERYKKFAQPFFDQAAAV
jgi:hypothetical protein